MGENDPTHTLINGDALSELRQLPSESVDVVITSPPYFIGKSYDASRSIHDFETFHEDVLPEILRVTRRGGSICWQTGYHVSDNEVVPLDFVVHAILSRLPDVRLRNRIIWRFGHGLHATKRFSGRHETILWYTRGESYAFDLEAVRVAQKYPGKRHFKGPKKGELSGTPSGKNPSDIWDFDVDVWDIPNVKGNHIEKTEHPCQFPIALPRRLINALCPPKGVVLDPFMGVGSTAVAAVLTGRNFIGFDANATYCDIAAERCEAAKEGSVRMRPDVPVVPPDPTQRVATRPDHFFSAEEAAAGRKAA